MICERASFHFFLLLVCPHPLSTLFPYTTLFRSHPFARRGAGDARQRADRLQCVANERGPRGPRRVARAAFIREDRKSTRLNSSHITISYAVFCLKKKKINIKLYQHLIIYIT